MSSSVATDNGGVENVEDAAKVDNKEDQLALDNSDFTIVENQTFYSRVLDYVRESYAEYSDEVQKDIAVFLSSRGTKMFLLSHSTVKAAIPEDLDTVMLGHFEISRVNGKKTLRSLYDQLRPVVQDVLLKPNNIQPRPIRTVDQCAEVQALIRASQILRPLPFPDGIHPLYRGRDGRRITKEPDGGDKK